MASNPQIVYNQHHLQRISNTRNNTTCCSTRYCTSSLKQQNNRTVVAIGIALLTTLELSYYVCRTVIGAGSLLEFLKQFTFRFIDILTHFSRFSV